LAKSRCKNLVEISRGSGRCFVQMRTHSDPDQQASSINSLDRPHMPNSLHRVRQRWLFRDLGTESGGGPNYIT